MAFLLGGAGINTQDTTAGVADPINNTGPNHRGVTFDAVEVRHRDGRLIDRVMPERAKRMVAAGCVTEHFVRGRLKSIILLPVIGTSAGRHFRQRLGSGALVHALSGVRGSDSTRGTPTKSNSRENEVAL